MTELRERLNEVAGPLFRQWQRESRAMGHLEQAIRDVFAPLFRDCGCDLRVMLRPNEASQGYDIGISSLAGERTFMPVSELLFRVSDSDMNYTFNGAELRRRIFLHHARVCPLLSSYDFCATCGEPSTMDPCGHCLAPRRQL